MALEQSSFRGYFPFLDRLRRQLFSHEEDIDQSRQGEQLRLILCQPSPLAALIAHITLVTVEGKKLHLRHLSADCRRLLHKARKIVEVSVIEDPAYGVAVDYAGNYVVMTEAQQAALKTE